MAECGRRTLLNVSPWLRRYSSFVMTCERQAALYMEGRKGRGQ